MELTCIPVHQITANSVVSYSEWPEGMPRRENTAMRDAFVDIDNTASGKVTKKVHAKIRKVTKAWFSSLYYTNQSKKHTNQLSGRRMKFVTLTLPSQQHNTDREIKRNGIRVFLQRLKRHHGITRYIWKAEKQQNGNVHFHILIDQFIEWKTLRWEWNSVLDNLGYITEYRNRMKAFHKDGFQPRVDLVKQWPLDKQWKAYKEGVNNNWSSPNTTDIHNLYNTRNPEAYISKYVSKSSQEQIIDGRVWECSDDVRQLSNYVNQPTRDIEALVELLKEDKRCFIFEDPNFRVITGPVAKIIAQRFPKLHDDICDYFACAWEAIEHAQPPP